MTTHYMKSNGDLIPIDGMAYTYLKNAIGVLERAADPKRQNELDAMLARKAVMDAEYADGLRAERAAPNITPERADEIDGILAKIGGGQ